MASVFRQFSPSPCTNMPEEPSPLLYGRQIRRSRHAAPSSAARIVVIGGLAAATAFGVAHLVSGKYSMYLRYGCILAGSRPGNREITPTTMPRSFDQSMLLGALFASS